MWRYAKRSLSMLLLLALALPPMALCQQKQIWFDYFGVRQFNPSWAVELNPGVSILLDRDGWKDYYFGATGMYIPLNWFEIDGGVEGHWTVDPVLENSIEIRPSLQTIFTWATYGEYLNLFYPALMLRFEERFLFYQESNTSQTLSRVRIAVSARFPLNSPTLDAGTWYLRFRFESFYDLGGEAKTRYASKRRLDGGIGHVLSPEWRLEFSVQLFRVRDNSDDTYHPSDLIFWFDARNFF